LVRDPPQLSGGGKRGADPPDTLAALIEHLAPTTSLCLVAHVRVQPQNPVLAAVRKAGGSIVQHAAPKGRELRGWVETAVREGGLRMPAGGTEHLLRTVGSDLGSMSTELDKLSAL